MGPGPSLLLAVVAAAATVCMAGAFTVAAGGHGTGAPALGEAGTQLGAYGRALVLLFAILIGLAVALVIAATFSSSLRRRAGALALLKANGVSTPMLLGAVVAQALTIGLLGGALGLLAGLGASRLPSAEIPSVLTVPWDSDEALLPLELAIGATLLATLVGALPPALHAAGLPAGPAPSPLPAAPRQADLPGVGGICGIALLAIGAVGTGVAWRMDTLPHRVGILGLAAGALLTGLLVGLPTLLQPLVALLGLPARLGSSGRLALRHLAADPRGAAAIAVAPMLAAMAASAGATQAVSLRAALAHGTAEGLSPEPVTAQLEALPTLMAGASALSGLCAAAALAAGTRARTDEGVLMLALGQTRGQRAAQLLCEFVLATAAGIVLGAAVGLLLAGATEDVLTGLGGGAPAIPGRQLALLLALGCGVGILSAAVIAVIPTGRRAGASAPGATPEPSW
ncbi:FtsX-like permease family protein [Actinomyces sp. 565]|uniref:FtsX-like permease family protein n=1 Tax=Actinomyces sp. 565 TaxID=2057794 RepID=UPI0013A7081E|nr:FtsX-like permease family protein [Actinomyces sp. 565]NDR53103.1 hypothetical protein [Actinomyces sp. 565]